MTRIRHAHRRRSPPRLPPFALLAILVAMLIPGPPPQAVEEPFTFALMGDTPYSRFERAHMPTLLERMASAGARFILHVGDFKSGQTPCSDAVFEDRLTLFDHQPLAFILTPGDNEWMDCGRSSAGGFDPLDRLAWLRAHFFPPGRSLGTHPLPVVSQAGDPSHGVYRENLRWRVGPVLFATLNVPGPDNNWGGGADPTPEYSARQAANSAWLATAFDIARRERLAAVVVAFQADPGFEDAASGRPQRGFRALLDQLREEAENFSGQLVIAHGDSHIHRIDHPLFDRQGRPLPRVTRVETHGFPFMGWVEVRVTPGATPLFRFTPHLYAPGEGPSP